jgi:glycosyltransferase involved in cell wall biosynthesis
MRILFLGDNLANAQQWKKAMRKIENVEVFEWSLSSNNKFKRIIIWIIIVFFGRWYFKRFKADLVIGYRTTSYGFLAAFSGIKPMVIAMQGESDIWPLTGFMVPLKTFMLNFTCKKTDLIHAWGDHMKKNILNSGVNPNKILVCPRGIDLNMFKFTSFENKKSEVPIFVSTRSLYPEYQFDLIIKGFELLDRENIKFQFNIIGDGSEFETLKKQISDAKLDNKVKLLGKIKNEDLPSYLAESHFYVSLPNTEGVSASLFEAMACGCFPIVSNLSANKLFINNNENGILIEDYSPETLAFHLQHVLKNNSWINSATLNNRNLVVEKADLSKNISLFIENYKLLIETK